MSATNSTPIINLPLFIGTDKPAWLVDWNGAMNIIDTNIAALQSAESGTAASLAALSQSVQALSGTVDQHTTALQTATQAIAGNTGSINTINSLIGNGQPTTEDKTIIGAINEIYAEIGSGSGVAAEDVTYSNTTSGLTATDVQAAIDEVNAKIPAGGAVDADDVVYDNTSSGLSATNVQDAIDEIALGSSIGAYTSVLHDQTLSISNQAANPTQLVEFTTAGTYMVFVSAGTSDVSMGNVLMMHGTDYYYLGDVGSSSFVITASANDVIGAYAVTATGNLIHLNVGYIKLA